MTHPIVACARGYLGTRFHHQGRLKRTHSHKGGIDCLGLLVCVARELDLKGPGGTPLSGLDSQDYPHMPDTTLLQQELARVLAPAQELQEGDIALFNVDGSPQHMAIISDGLGMIHAYAPARAVVEHALDRYWLKKLVRGYRLISS